MISQNEILMSRIKYEDLTLEQKSNFDKLLFRINIIRSLYKKPMIVTSGFRRPQDNPANGAPKSNHFKAAAIDIKDDAQGTLWKWLLEPSQMKVLQSIGLWLEHGCYTHGSLGNWVHFQVVPPGSKKRIFIPSSQPNPNPSFWNGIYDKTFDQDLSA